MDYLLVMLYKTTFRRVKYLEAKQIYITEQQERDSSLLSFLVCDNSILIQ